MNKEEIEMNNNEKMIELVYNKIGHFKKISPMLVMKKFKLSEEIAKIICQKIWLINHIEAKRLAKDVEAALYS